jgi:crotonobetainyl-CoA:carnitine CoA-transferase CaiB-like acyl-CoA transferase
MYGMMHVTGSEETNSGGAGDGMDTDTGTGMGAWSEPIKPGVAVVDVMTGMLAQAGVLAALYERDAGGSGGGRGSGLGQRVDTSLMEAQVRRMHVLLKCRSE